MCLVKNQRKRRRPWIYRLWEDCWGFLRVPQWLLVFGNQLVAGALAPRLDVVSTHLQSCGISKMCMEGMAACPSLGKGRAAKLAEAGWVKEQVSSLQQQRELGKLLGEKSNKLQQSRQSQRPFKEWLSQCLVILGKNPCYKELLSGGAEWLLYWFLQTLLWNPCKYVYELVGAASPLLTVL